MIIIHANAASQFSLAYKYLINSPWKQVEVDVWYSIFISTSNIHETIEVNIYETIFSKC